MLTRRPFPPALLLNSSATLYKVNDLKKSRSSTSYANLYFQVAFSLALPSWLRKVPNCCRYHALFGLVSVSAFRSLCVSFELVIVYLCSLISLRERTPEIRPVPVTDHSLQSAKRKDRLDRELELVKQQKEKLALELEVLRLRQAIAPAPPPTAPAVPCEKPESQQKKRSIDWPQHFVPGMSVNPEFNSLDLASFVEGYLAMIRTYDPELTAHMLAILEILMVKAISYTWASVRGFYFYLARQVELRRLDWDCLTEIREMASTSFKH